MEYEKIIKSKMALKGLRQEDMAQKLKIALPTFNKKLVRKGTCKFNIDEAIMLARVLECTLDEIFLTKEVA